MIENNVQGISEADSIFIRKILSKVDYSYVKDPKGIQEIYTSMVNSIIYFNLMNNHTKILTVNKEGKALSYLDVFGNLMSQKLSLSDQDLDLVVMRHNFTIEDQNKVRWNEYSTMIAIG